MLKKLLSLVLATIMVVGMGATALAADYTDNGNKNDAPAPTPFRYQERSSGVSTKEIAEAQAQGLQIISKITDPALIQKMVNEGLAECGENGSIPTCITTYFAPDQETFPSSTDNNSSSKKAAISVTKTKYFDGQYFDDYDRYKVEGPGEFSVLYSKKGIRNWNTSISGNVSAGGSIYGVADVKAAVSSSVGYSFGAEETKRQTYKGNIPKGKYWEIKVWTSFLVYEYTAKVGTKTIGTGKTWRPNGLIIKNTEYSK